MPITNAARLLLAGIAWMVVHKLLTAWGVGGWLMSVGWALASLSLAAFFHALLRAIASPGPMLRGALWAGVVSTVGVTAAASWPHDSPGARGSLVIDAFRLAVTVVSITVVAGLRRHLPVESPLQWPLRILAIGLPIWAALRLVSLVATTVFLVTGFEASLGALRPVATVVAAGCLLGAVAFLVQIPRCRDDLGTTARE